VLYRVNQLSRLDRDEGGMFLKGHDAESHLATGAATITKTKTPPRRRWGFSYH